MKGGFHWIRKEVISCSEALLSAEERSADSCRIQIIKLKKYMATKGTVSGVIANMVTLVVDGPVAQMRFVISRPVAIS